MPVVGLSAFRLKYGQAKVIESALPSTTEKTTPTESQSISMRLTQACPKTFHVRVRGLTRAFDIYDLLLPLKVRGQV